MQTLSPPKARFPVPKPRLFEEKPRWKGAPKICLATNLPAFATEKEMAAFNDANCPSVMVIKKWKCTVCGHWHQWCSGPDPAGMSSGTTRSAKGKDTTLEWLMNSPLARTIPDTTI